jgi:hypothetical protein
MPIDTQRASVATAITLHTHISYTNEHTSLISGRGKRSKQARRIAIAVKSAVSTAGRSLRVYLNNRTSSAMAATSQKGQQQTHASPN